jgi:hypothetical protein
MYNVYTADLLLTFCCAFAACTCFQVTPCILRSLSACLLGPLERFSYGRGRSRSLLPCPAMSTLTSCLACTVRLQHACVRPCTVQIVTFQHLTTICTALPACHLSCMPSNKLIFLIYRYVAIHVLASLPSAPRLSEADSKTSTG